MQNEESKMMKFEDESCVDIADEKYDAKLLEGEPSAVFQNKMNQHEDEVLDDVTQIFNNQSRVEDSSRANVISLEQICKRQDCQGMVECSEAPGANISPANYEV